MPFKVNPFTEELDETSHNLLSDDDHTQYALLAGRATGQTLQGGTGSGENLTFESTSHATKGVVSVLEGLKVDGLGAGSYLGAVKSVVAIHQDSDACYGLVFKADAGALTNTIGLWAAVDGNFYADQPTVGTWFSMRQTTGGVAFGAALPDSSAVVDIQSTARGFLMPRMTTGSRDSIASPVEGLMIYNTSTSRFNYRTGAGAWAAISEFTTPLPLADGGTAAALTASNGGIFYSTASAGAILAGTATAGLALISGASTTPSWFAPTAGSVLFAGTGGILEQDNANLFWDNTNNKLGVNTISPASTYGGVDIASGGISLVLGAEHLTTGTRTNATAKYGRIGLYHYTNAEKPIAIIMGQTSSGNNMIYIGGGTNIENASTEMRIYHAANGTTVTGTEVVRTVLAGMSIKTSANATAYLHLGAGTATASTAPLKFTSGTLLTTAEAGAVEFLTDAFYGTITTGAARKTFAFLESPSFTTPVLGAASATTLLVGATANFTDFPNATAVISQGNTTYTDTGTIYGLVFEALASGTTQQTRALQAVAYTSATEINSNALSAVFGYAKCQLTTTTGDVVGVFGYAAGDHASGDNIAFKAVSTDIAANNISLDAGNDPIRIGTGYLTDANNNELLKFSTVVSAVNELTVANAATLGAPVMSATGGDANIDITLTPKGTGSINISKVNIDAGTIDGSTIATSDVTVGAGKTLDVSAGTLTLADNQISGDKVEGGTIAATTITTLTSTTANITTLDTNVAAAGVTLAGTTLAADGTDANIPITITPKGTGAVVIPVGAVGTPSLSFTADPDTGIFRGGANSWNAVANGATVCTFNASGLDAYLRIDMDTNYLRFAAAGRIRRSTVTNITASTTQTQAGGTALTAENNVITVCANANDTVVLPTAVVGIKVNVYNRGAQNLRVYPFSGDDLGAGVNAVEGTPIPTMKTYQYFAIDATTWIRSIYT